MNKKFCLEEDEMDPSPFIQFGKWFQERLNSGVVIPESVSLGTSSRDGSVSVRTVLLKEYDRSGFVFFSNYNSRKGIQIDHNPRVALLFYWAESDRQIRIEGTVQKVPPEESDRYFNTRPEESRLSAWASEQSKVIPDRKYLEDRFEFYRNKFSNRSIDRPPHWGGYHLKPTWFEFWQAREHRLHDRICYSLSGDKWIINRLAP
jgi:pyridoxamine 5'-phosphate oxidase